MKKESSRNHCRKQGRRSTGSVLVLAMFLLSFIVLPLGSYLYKYSLLLTTRDRYKRHVEAAALVVAKDLSTLIVNDPHFGFIGLSNSPPIGKATFADDQEPCPVNGINNLLATIRLANDFVRSSK